MHIESRRRTYNKMYVYEMNVITIKDNDDNIKIAQ